MKIDKKNIIKYTGAGILVLAISGLGGIILEEGNTDHLNETCIISKTFGLAHQAQVINNASDYIGYMAIYYDGLEIPDGYVANGDGTATKTVYAPTKTMTDIYGNNVTVYEELEGYDLVGNTLKKTISIDERVEIYDMLNLEGLTLVNTIKK